MDISCTGSLKLSVSVDKLRFSMNDNNCGPVSSVIS